MKDDATVVLTAGKIREAAEKCPTAREVLETLCPGVFGVVNFDIGDVVSVGDLEGIVIKLDRQKDPRVEFFNHGEASRRFAGETVCGKFSGPFHKKIVTLIHRPSLKCEPK